MKYLAFLVSWMLFLLGDFVIGVLVRLYPPIFYPIYCKLMWWSCIISDKYNLNIWKDVE
jgi:hypothetical protein